MTNANSKNVAELLEKTAAYIDVLKNELDAVKHENSLLRMQSSSGNSLSKLAAVADLDVETVHRSLIGLSPSQRKIFEKVASDDDFSLGDLTDDSSDRDSSADDGLLSFCID